MSQTITKGFLIARLDHDTFDEIITFIDDYGNKFVCLAKGTKKIYSKMHVISKSVIIVNSSFFYHERQIK